jgi:preprotein translocase subunit YajC
MIMKITLIFTAILVLMMIIAYALLIRDQIKQKKKIIENIKRRGHITYRIDGNKATVIEDTRNIKP